MRIFYYQVTLGHPHFARIRALNELEGVECIGVQLASRERSRRYAMDTELEPFVQTVLEGVYEDLPLLQRVRATLAHLRAGAPDLVVLDDSSDPVQLVLGVVAMRRGIPTFIRWASTWFDYPRVRWRERLKRFLYAHWDGYLATGIRARDYLRSLGVPAERIHICGNPVDARPIEHARTQHDRSASFLFVGRFIWHKNLPRFLASYSLYRAEGGQWRLEIVGFGSAEEEARLKEASLDTPGVEFFGHLQQSELIARYRLAGALVLPSISETWGLVINEAMHAGLPVVVSDRCGCVPELLEPGRSGLLVDPEDTRAMADALHQIERATPDERQAMADAAADRLADQTPAVWARRVVAAATSA